MHHRNRNSLVREQYFWMLQMIFTGAFFVVLNANDFSFALFKNDRHNILHTTKIAPVKSTELERYRAPERVRSSKYFSGLYTKEKALFNRMQLDWLGVNPVLIHQKKNGYQLMWLGMSHAMKQHERGGN